MGKEMELSDNWEIMGLYQGGLLDNIQGPLTSLDVVLPYGNQHLLNTFFGLFVFMILGIEPRAYTLSYVLTSFLKFLYFETMPH